jgi:O-methyltransferase
LGWIRALRWRPGARCAGRLNLWQREGPRSAISASSRGCCRARNANPNRQRAEIERLQNLLVRAGQEANRRGQETDQLRAELADAWAHAHKLDAALQRVDAIFRSADYNCDSLLVYDKNVSFLRDDRFMNAYRRGVHSGHRIGRKDGHGQDIHIEWRVHVACWAAERARRLPGSFVECGGNTGILSLAVCEYVDFNSTAKDFFLFDTFCGIPESQMRAEERPHRTQENADIYEECFDVVSRNFAPYPRARLVRGLVPDTLATAAIDRVCYLSIDMNIVEPEIAAMEFFWDKLVPGAAVILDDYGWKNYVLQQEAHDRFAAGAFPFCCCRPDRG